jgi:oxygen-independent coproporphyrinogen-3 oxidase
LLLIAGYVQVGLDHFVREDDETLSCCTNLKHCIAIFRVNVPRRTTGQVYAFGVTAISQLSNAYAQNTKNISEYIETVNRGHIPVKKGYSLNFEEQITREVITELMCNEQINWQELAVRMQRSIDEVKTATAYSEKKMRAFEQDGIIVFDDQKIVMKQKGSPFVRNVAASLDKLLINSDKTFSKPI